MRSGGRDKKQCRVKIKKKENCRTELRTAVLL